MLPCVNLYYIAIFYDIHTNYWLISLINCGEFDTVTCGSGWLRVDQGTIEMAKAADRKWRILHLHFGESYRIEMISFEKLKLLLQVTT